MAGGEIPEQKVGEVKLNGVPMEVFGDSIDLPTDESQRSICAAHLQEGRVGAMMDDFWMAVCHFPEAGTDNTSIHLALSCKGISRFRKQCRLTLAQQDDNGKQLTKGTWQD